MENNNFNPMMMGMNNPMMMGMNNQMMGGMNNPMMNMPQNMGMMGMGMMDNFPQPQNNPGLNNLNDLDNDRINNPDSKTVRLYYDDEFIQSVTLSNNDDYNSISNTFKQILFSRGKKSYRDARPEEIIERDSPDETLEFLIDRGVVDNNPRVEITVISE